jgi:hypothetical protein
MASSAPQAGPNNVEPAPAPDPAAPAPSRRFSRRNAAPAAPNPAVPAPSGRVLRPRTKVVSHKNTCGADAPSTNLGREPRSKNQKKSQTNTFISTDKSKEANYVKLITQGERLETGTVRYINISLQNFFIDVTLPLVVQ